MVDSKANNAYQTFTGRNLGIITPEQQERLRKATICVFGMGGIGSPAFEVLVRTGVGKFKIVDKDVFDASNMNRQIFAYTDTVDKKKTEVARNFASKINPDVQVDCFDHVDADNIGEILDSADLSVLAIDELKPCIIISRKAREMEIPLVEGWAIPYVNVRTFTPDIAPLEEAYGLPTLGRDLSEFSDEELSRLGTELLFGLGKIEGIAEFYSEEVIERIAQGVIPSFAPMAWLTSVMMAMEALKVLLGMGEVAMGPDFTLYDPFQHRIPGIMR